MNRILFTLLVSPFACFGQMADTKSNYQKVFDELFLMSRNDVPLSLKRAVFITENAYFDNQFSYDDFSNQIDRLVALSKAVAAADGLSYDGKDRQSVLLSASIFRVMKDSLVFENSERNQSFKKFPFVYDMEDFWGERDWSKMFVMKLLITNTGNCHSLPLLYKILADELGTDAWLAVAPSHTYIKQWSDKTGWYNTELTTGQFPFDKDIKLNSYIPTEAIAEGVFMDTLSTKENIAYVMTDLAQGYVKKVGYEDIETPIKWLDLALQLYPDYVNALILKAELQKKQYESLMFESGVSQFRDFAKNSLLKKKLEELEHSYLAIHQLGYRRMPKEMYLNWLFRVQKDTTRQPFQFATPQPFEKYKYNVQVVTAGDGQNYEFFDQDTVVRIGTVALNVASGNIVKFVEYDADDIRDEVVSRMYDPALGRFWRPDRFSETFHSLSPYQFAANNPITNKDINGDFIVSIHYQMTYDVLKKYGYADAASDAGAYYSSYYADRPNGRVTWGNNRIAKSWGMATVSDRPGWNDDATINSQDTSSPIESQRHSMEGDNESIGALAAKKRGQEFGWSKIFEAAKAGTPDTFKKGSKAAKAFGVGIHALQDSKAHAGVKMEDHDINKDMGQGEEGLKAYKEGMNITESAILVTQMLNGDFSNIKDGTTIEISGMNNKQLQQVIEAAFKSEKKVTFKNEYKDY